MTCRDWLMQLLAAAALLAIASTGSAAQTPTKNCYEDIGCPWKEEAKFDVLRKLSCENLAHVRNRLYHENGYCFHSKAPRDLYGNAGCKHPVQSLVPLNRFEQGNIAKIRRVEREKRCKGVSG